MVSPTLGSRTAKEQKRTDWMLAGARWTAHDAGVSTLAVLTQAATAAAGTCWLLSGSADCSLRVWDLGTNLLLHTLLGHHDQVMVSYGMVNVDLYSAIVTRVAR